MKKPKKLKLDKLKPGQALAICWHDAYSTDAWDDMVRHEQDIDRAVMVTTLGFFLGVGKHNIRLVGSCGSNDQGFHVLTIPLAWTTEIRKVECK